MIRGDHRDLHTSCVWYIDRLFKLQIDDILGVDSQLLTNKIRGHTRAVYGAMGPCARQANIVIAVEVTEEVSLASFHGTISERIYADGQTGQDLVERTCPCVGWLAS